MGSDGSASSSAGEPRMVWRVREAVRRPRRAAVLAATCLGLSFVVHVAFRSLLFDVLALGAFVLATRGFWAPVRFQCGPEGVEIREPGRSLFYRWTRFRAFRLSGARLSLYFPAVGNESPPALVLPLTEGLESSLREFLRENTGLVEQPSP